MSRLAECKIFAYFIATVKTGVFTAAKSDALKDKRQAGLLTAHQLLTSTADETQT